MQKQFVRETAHYTVQRSVRGFRITAKDKRSTPRSRVVSVGCWSILERMSDSGLDGSVCLELGIGVWRKAGAR